MRNFLQAIAKSFSIILMTISMNALANPPVAQATDLAQIPARESSAVVPATVPLAVSSYILIDGEEGRVLVEYNADKQFPPANLTKMMSSYMVMDSLARGKVSETDKVNISAKAWKTRGSRMYVREGAKVPVIDLLRGDIIQSGNDATLALAEHIGGTEEVFIGMMNKTAQTLGMVSTHFQSATGLPSENHYTTARDVAILARAIIKDHPSYYPLYSEKVFKYNNIRQPNRNPLLIRDSTVDGLKTGYSEDAGFHLVASSKHGSTRLIAVLVGAKSKMASVTETQELLAYGFRHFETIDLYKGNTKISDAQVWAGKTPRVILGLTRDVRMTIACDRVDDLKAKVTVNESIKAPLVAGQELGSLTIELDGKIIQTEPLISLQSVEKMTLLMHMWVRVTSFFGNLFG